METILTLALLAASSTQTAPPAIHEHELEFHAAGELLPWCEREARAHYAGRGLTTYQWTARYVERGNTLVVEGKLRADGDDVPVTCRVARGARERHAVIIVDDPARR